MPQPKKKLSATRQKNRRSHLHLDVMSSAVCAHCKTVITPHTVCTACGYYKGKPVLPTAQTK